jgi:hypothetical protein
MRLYVATCITNDGKIITITNNSYEALLDGIKRYDYTILIINEKEV